MPDSVPAAASSAIWLAARFGVGRIVEGHRIAGRTGRQILDVQQRRGGGAALDRRARCACPCR